MLPTYRLREALVFLMLCGLAIAVLGMSALLAGTVFDDDRLVPVGQIVMLSGLAVAICFLAGANRASRRLARDWMRDDLRDRERRVLRLAAVVPVAVVIDLVGAGMGVVSWTASLLMIAVALILPAELLVARLVVRVHLRKHHPEGFWWTRRYLARPIDLRRVLESTAPSKGMSIQDEGRWSSVPGTPFTVLREGEIVARVRRWPQTFGQATLTEVKPGPSADQVKMMLDDVASRVG